MNGTDSGASITYHHSLITNHRNFLGALGAGTIVVLFCFVLLWHDPLLFWNDDYQLSILPVFADVARSWSEGHFPLLSPYSWVCGNLAGEFQYGTFSVFVNAVVVLIWKLPLSFPQQAAALSMTHLFVLGMGGYLLARGRNLSSPLALMVALVTALNGWIICWGATDWFGALGAFAWFPWAWWAMERALDSRRGRWRFLWPAPFVYLLVAGGFPYTVLMLAVLAAWLAFKSLGQNRSLSAIWPLLLGLALGLGLSSPAWLALLDYVQGSARQSQESAAHFQWLVPASSLPGFILPHWTVNWADFSTRFLPHTATELACGLVPPVALLAGFATCGRALLRQIKWELGLLLLVLIIAMLPSASVFRWSFRWLPFVHVLLGLCAAEALRVLGSRKVGLTEEVTREAGKGRFSTLVTPGLVGFALAGLAIVASWAFQTLGAHAFPFVWISLGIAAAWTVLERTGLRQWAAAIIAFTSLLVTYLCLPPNCGVPKYNLAQELTKPAPLDPERLYLSVYPAPEFAYRLENNPEPFGTTLRPGSTSMWGGIHLINGYSPIRPSGVAREFDFAIHGEIRPDIAESLLEHESGVEGTLARLGVDGIIVANEMALRPQPEAEWEVAVATEEGRVFHRRPGALDRVRSITAIDSRPNEQFASAAVSRIINGRNRLMADVTVPPNGRPALLTISRPFFEGYRAKIGDVLLKVESYRGLMPMVEIPAGANGRLTLVYRPWWLVYGGAIFFACLTFVMLATLSAWRLRSAAN
ncbi:MAG TPA: hypothetical protein VGW39_06235 [Chthoniobacterales bacterium]|nr:hypothetical protein [Chthoniobacterales bacterium]